MRLVPRTDADILEKLDAIQNKQGYIKALIRADIAAQKEEERTMKYQINYTDPATGATSPIDTVSAKPGYTAEEYIAACDQNADQEWCDMLHAGTVTVEALEDQDD